MTKGHPHSNHESPTDVPSYPLFALLTLLTLDNERASLLDTELVLNLSKVLLDRDGDRVGEIDRKVSRCVLVGLLDGLDPLARLWRVEDVVALTGAV